MILHRCRDEGYMEFLGQESENCKKRFENCEIDMHIGSDETLHGAL